MAGQIWLDVEEEVLLGLLLGHQHYSTTLPEDATLVDIYWDPRRGMFNMLLESEEFAEHGSNGIPPTVRFETRRCGCDEGLILG